MVKNQAFVFIKPHAVTDKVKDLVTKIFEKREIEVKKEGSIEAKEIDERKCIDKHYYAIAAKATLKKPSELNVPKEKFKDFFGLEWEDALKADKVFNAKDACEKLGVDAVGIDGIWATAKKAGKLIKFGGGFYCGELPCGDDKIYVFNAFFMSMRSKFVAEGTSIYYYIVEWDSKTLSWEDFRGEVLGPTDPSTAPAESCRGKIMAEWKELGLSSEPNTGDNGVHASASPFEAFAERANWLGYRADRDPFGKLLLKAGVSRGLIKEWSTDPQVTFGVLPMTQSIFDTLEDTDSDYCLALCQMIASFSGEVASRKSSPLEKELEELKEQLTAYEALGQAVAAFQAFTPPAEVASSQTKGKGEGKGATATSGASTSKAKRDRKRRNRKDKGDD
jgi:nucleoside diphosphate kinase